MAKISLQKPMYSKIKVNIDADGKESEELSEAKVLSKAIRSTVTINSTDLSLYADDSIAEYVAEFVDGQITFEGDDLEDSVIADVMGASIDSGKGVITFKADDNANYIRLGFIVGRIKGNKKQYKAVIYTKIKFDPIQDDFETKGQTIVFKTSTLSGKIMRNADGIWKLATVWDDEYEKAENFLKANVGKAVGE